MSCPAFKNTGNVASRCNKGVLIGGFISEKLFTRTKTNIITQADWEELIQANKPERVYPLFDKRNPAVVSQRELIIETNADGSIEGLGSNAYSFQIDINNPTDKEISDKLFKGLGTADVYMMLVTEQGYFEANEESDESISARRFTVSKTVIEQDGYSTSRKLRFQFTEQTTNENIEKQYSVKPTDFSIYDLNGIQDVELQIVSSIATAIVFTANAYGDVNFNISDLGTDTGDYTLEDGAIVSIAYSSVTGQYTATCTDAATGTFALNAPVVTGDDYEQVNETSITVS